MEFLSQSQIRKIGTPITFDFRMIVSMVFIIILSIIITIVIILFELNWIVEYLIDLDFKITHLRVPIGQVSFITVLIIENIFSIDETEWIMNDKQKPRKIQD